MKIVMKRRLFSLILVIAVLINQNSLLYGSSEVLTESSSVIVTDSSGSEGVPSSEDVSSSESELDRADDGIALAFNNDSSSPLDETNNIQIPTQSSNIHSADNEELAESPHTVDADNLLAKNQTEDTDKSETLTIGLDVDNTTIQQDETSSTSTVTSFDSSVSPLIESEISIDDSIKKTADVYFEIDSNSQIYKLLSTPI